MVPLRLFIKNFLSYGNTTQSIDFTPYQLICLSGKNGHGKSALLDALTWNIWGQARKIQTATRADEGLMRLGQSTMMTSLDLACKNVTYRIRREYAVQQGKAQHTLDFGIVDPSSQQVKSLSEKTVRATQEKIISIIGLDYDGFINSVFLKQGASNEFSKKSPKERKEILCSMLGINHFEDIKKRAHDKSRMFTHQHELFSATHQRLTRELEEKTTLQQQLASVCTHEKELQTTQAVLQESFTILQARLQTYRAQQQLHQTASEQLSTITQQYTTALTELPHERTAWKNALKKKTFLAQQPTDGAQARTVVIEELATLAQLDAHEQQLRQELQTSTLAAEHEKHLRTFTYQARAEHAQKILSLREDTMRSYEQEKKILASERAHFLTPLVFERYKETYHRLLATKNQLKPEQQAHQLSLLAQNAECPTCEKQLAASEKSQLTKKLSAQHTHTLHRAARLQRILPALKQKLIQAHELLSVYERAQKLEAQLAQHEQEYLSAVQERDQAHQALTLATGPEITLLSQQVAELAKNNAARLERKKELEVLRDSLLTHTGDHEMVHTLCTQTLRMIRARLSHLRDLKQRAALLGQQHTELQKSLAQSHTILQEEVTLKNKLAVCQQQLQELYQQKGILEEKLKQKSAQEKECTEINQQILALAEQIQQYTIISQAVGRDGLQALLIEQAIPEIEQEANQLLEKLTDNQAHLSIESVRDLKSGKTKETLDIHISDASGIRAYELFSGGEAFRIDFALRIALSKLLARRAGTSLQTLIIDEGFGSQDEEGLSHMLDALYKIQDDFAKIIIVSHLPFMKDHFPVHFVVSKSASGSTVKVIEQG